MKHNPFKIADSTLFVYKSPKTLKNGTILSETDPTTTVMTMTVTGLQPQGKVK